jgi:short-subunit dehydrogenase
MRPTQDPRPLAVVTGASSGIGEKMAVAFARRGFDLVVVARRADRLTALQTLITSTCGVDVECVAADLASRAGLALVQQALADRDVDVLVNNAGAGWIGTFAEAPMERQLEIIDVNCRSLIGLTQAVLPGMLQRRRGRVVQIASVAGFMPGPRSSVYYASKAFVVSHSEALRHELADSGVTVTLVCPGPVATEFQRSSGVRGTMGGAALMSDVAVAEASVEAALAGRFLVVPGFANRLLVALSALLPRRLTAALVDRLQRKRQEAGADDV